MSGFSSSPNPTKETLAEPLFPHFVTGFPSARVGLGSPQLDAWFGRRSRRGSNGSDSEKRRSELASSGSSDRRRSVVSTVSGLPSPPGTNSDVALPNLGEPSLMMESPPIDLSSPNAPARPRPLSQPISNLALSTSTSSRENDLTASNQTLRPPERHLSRSASSSSSVSPRSAELPDILPERRYSQNGRTSLEIRQSPRASSPTRQDQRSPLGSPGSHSRHRKSPSAPLPRSPNKSRLSLDRSLTASPIDEEEPETRHVRRQSTGVDLDAKIREAEEKIRLSARPRTSQGLKETPTHQTIRKHDSYSRASNSPIPRSGTDTLRRSAGGTIKRSPRGLDPEELNSLSEKNHSGSSGSAKRKPLPASFRNSNGMFTPSPSVKSHDRPTPPTQDTSPAESRSPLAQNRFSTTSRLAGSPRESDRFRSPQAETRPWPESISRGQSLRESTGGVFDSRSRTDSLRAKMSRMALSPSDSVSAIGSKSDYPSPSKDPLEVLKRIEAQRHSHNRSWDAERSGSVIGNRPTSGPESPRPRPTTSMASLRSPRVTHESPVALRSSRLSQFDSEPRTKRSTTSLGGRSGTSLDIHTASTDHGRLLFEACRALDLKIPFDSPALTELLRTFSTASKSAERINTAVRTAVDLGDRAISDRDLAQLDDLLAVLREAGRASDQNIRDLTRIMLDLPRILRDPRSRRESFVETTPRQSIDFDSQRYRPRPISPVRRPISPIRRSEDLPRPSTSASFYSPPSRRPRESLPPSFISSPANRGVSALVSRVRANLGSSRRDLGAIEASPPLPPGAAKIATPLSPARRTPRKKSSVNSMHTVRGSGAFLPESRGKATTAISAITAGNSPTVSRFAKSSMDWDREDIPEVRASTSPMSRLSSYHTAEGDDDAVSLLEHRLADAQRLREEEGGTDLVRRATIGSGERRKESVSERFRATLRRNRDGERARA